MRVYIAGPISTGDQFLNCREAMLAADKLLQLGHTPFIPHLGCFWHIVSPKSYDTWLKYDLEWLDACDAVLRLPGHSPGANREVARAVANGKPVFYSIEGLGNANGKTT
jgi:hypothetical protein